MMSGGVEVIESYALSDEIELPYLPIVFRMLDGGNARAKPADRIAYRVCVDLVARELADIRSVVRDDDRVSVEIRKREAGGRALNRCWLGRECNLIKPEGLPPWRGVRHGIALVSVTEKDPAVVGIRPQCARVIAVETQLRTRTLAIVAHPESIGGNHRSARRGS
jgi:hypothetical protein